MMKFLKSKVGTAALGVSLLGALAASPAAHASSRTPAVQVSSAAVLSAMGGGGHVKCSFSSDPKDHLTVRAGSRNTSVRHAQCLLRYYNGFSTQKVTGFFGAQTYRNVRSFQSSNGLSKDGIVGQKSWGKLHP
jgi:peptidoglycan hydrolase-like protein with peptidoglycan-binding domain